MNRNSIVAIVRSYRNKGVLDCLSSLRSYVEHTILVINAKEDKGYTLDLLGDHASDPALSVIELADYTWSKALNRALEETYRSNAHSEGKYRFAFPVSVEAQFSQKHMGKLLETFSDESVGIVGTSFKGIQHGKEIGLGKSYKYPRNTGMMIRLSIFNNPLLGKFDSIGDSSGGMEDLDLVTRMLAFSNYTYQMIDLGVPLVVGDHYNQVEKEKREEETMQNIAAVRMEQASALEKAWKKFNGPESKTDKLRPRRSGAEMY